MSAKMARRRLRDVERDVVDWLVAVVAVAAAFFGDSSWQEETN